MPAVARTLSPSDAPEVVDVLVDAFAKYPVMEYVLGPDSTTHERLTELIGFFVYRRIRLGGPMYGVTGSDGHLVGAAVMTLPSEPEPSSEVLATRDRTWASLGTDCRDRHDAYGAVAKSVLISEPHHHLNMIGVRHASHGGGVARPLLEAAIELAASDPQSAGLTLTTEVPRNVELYNHFGFKVVRSARVTPDFQTWGMFRSN